MPTLPDDRLLRVSKAKKDQLEAWKEGVNLNGITPISQIVLQIAAHRWRLARLHLIQGNRLYDSKPRSLRGAISRYYYSIYHALRTSAYIFHGGDDYEEHRKLPQYVPNDFPNQNYWQNAIKDAREKRNQADYDPYPRMERRLSTEAAQIRADAIALLPITKTYLLGKGCKIS